MNSEQLNKQEPKAWLVKEDGVTRLHWSKPEHGYEKCEPLYTAPPVREWVGLTDDEIAESAERMEAIDPTDYFWRDFALAIEAKLKEKNT